MPNQIIYNGKKYSGNYPTDLAENVVSFESADESNPSSFQEMPPFTAPGRMKTLMHNLSIAYKNLRYLVKLFGTTDISTIGDGTVSGILKRLNGNYINMEAGKKDVQFSNVARSYTIEYRKQYIKPVVLLSVISGSLAANARAYIIEIHNTSFDFATYKNIEEVDNGSVCYIVIESDFDSE